MKKLILILLIFVVSLMSSCSGCSKSGRKIYIDKEEEDYSTRSIPSLYIVYTISSSEDIRLGENMAVYTLKPFTLAFKNSGRSFYHVDKLDAFKVGDTLKFGIRVYEMGQ